MCTSSKAGLKSNLGLLSYYSRFLPNLPNTLASLYRQLRHNVHWKWGDEKRRAFEASKKLLLSSQVLVHFDPQQEVILACDASAYGIGAVLSHKTEDGAEKPIGFASRTLTDTKQKYSQVEKEGLACVFGVTRFHAYLFGHHFTLITDNKAIMHCLTQTNRFHHKRQDEYSNGLSNCQPTSTPYGSDLPISMRMLTH